MQLLGCLFSVVFFAIFFVVALALGVFNWVRSLFGTPFSPEGMPGAEAEGPSMKPGAPAEPHFDKSKGKYVDFEEVTD